MNNKKKIKFIGFGHAAGVLQNFSSPALFVGAVAMLLASFWLLLATSSVGVTVGIGVGYAFSSALMFFLPPNAFSGGYLGGKRKHVSELELAERRILTFLKGKNSKLVTIALFIVYSTLFSLVIFFASQSSQEVKEIVLDVEETAGLSIVGGLFSFISFFMVDTCVIYWIILLNWEKIQKSCIPWSKDKPYIEVATFTSPRGQRSQRSQRGQSPKEGTS